MDVTVIDLGMADYNQAYAYQKERLKLRQARAVPDTLIFCRHKPVFTIGRSGSRDNIKVSNQLLDRLRVEVCYTDRGGDVTYHGPGQLIVYPIFDLKNYGRDVHLFLRNLEEVVIRFLGHLGIDASRREGYTGVWVKKAKIASIGIGISRWVSFHGLGVNIWPENEYFSMINPCGLKDVHMTSVAELITSLGELNKSNPEYRALDKSELEWKFLKRLLTRYFEQVFNVSCHSQKEIPAVA